MCGKSTSQGKYVKLNAFEIIAHISYTLKEDSTMPLGVHVCAPVTKVPLFHCQI